VGLILDWLRKWFMSIVAPGSVTFNESGLPLGWTWSVSMDGTQKTATVYGALGGYQITFDNVRFGSHQYSIPSQGQYQPNPASGTIDVTRSTPNPTVHVVFSKGGSPTPQPGTQPYSVTFNEDGLPFGYEWGVDLGGDTQSTTVMGAAGGFTITFNLSQPGTYYYTVPSHGSYVPNPASGSVEVSDSNPNPTVYITFSQSGSGGTGGGGGTSQPTSYSVTFNENGLPIGWEWGVILNGQKQTTTNWGSENNGWLITFNNLQPGTYSYTVPSHTPYYPNPASGSVTVSDSNPNPTVYITFSSQ